MKFTLLSRDDFRESVYARDKFRCVVCGEPGVDAHHIIERRLFPDGGYYLDNGVTVCATHHLDCERTLISPDELRAMRGINQVVLPGHLYSDEQYDKWGNIMLANGQRLKGELFFDESVQKVLADGGVLDLFSSRVKYPRTHHLPWSDGMNDDDRRISSMDAFIGQRVIVTEKKDGENTTMYNDCMHARSVDSRNHESRNWVKARVWAQIAGDIPTGWRVCGENLFAQHSIAYCGLKSYFLGFSIWDERNIKLPWDETLQWFELLGLEPVPVLYDGIYDEKAIRALYNPKLHHDSVEGYVISLADAIPYGQFRSKVAKFVRAGHVQTAKHWMSGQRVVPNRLLAIQTSNE
jgi:hypothetical protein